MLMKFKDVLQRTREALSLYKVYCNSAFLVLNGTLLVSVNALLAISFDILVCLYFESLRGCSSDAVNCCCFCMCDYTVSII